MTNSKPALEKCLQQMHITMLFYNWLIVIALKLIRLLKRLTRLHYLNTTF